jgi:flagellar FliJ protein
MSSTPSPLLLVLEAAEKTRDAALADLDKARKAYDASRQQSQSLTDWRREYQNKWQAQFRQVGGMEIIRCYQDFMLRLGDAVSDQDKRVEQARVYMERCREQLIERERKVAAVTQLMERRQAELQLAENRRDQKATDEMAARAGRSSQGFGPGSSPMASGSY